MSITLFSKNGLKRVTFGEYVNWAEFYDNNEKEDPRYMPESHGKPIMISAFVDKDHAGNLVTRSSHT